MTAPTTEKRVAALREKYMKNPRDDAFLNVLADLIEFSPNGDQPLAPVYFGRHRETRGLILSAPSGDGKTALVNRNLATCEGVGLWDGETGRALEVSVPGEATLKSVAISILKKTGYPVPTENIRIAEAWNIVRHRLSVLGIKVLWIDEAHHLLSSAPGRDAAMALRMLKSLLQGEQALVVILSGIPDLEQLIGKDEETSRRFLRMRLAPVGSEEERRHFARYVSALCKNAGIRELDDPHFLDRLLHASGGSLGKMIELTLMALGRAETEDTAALELAQFRRALRLLGRQGPIGAFDDTPWDELREDLDPVVRAAE